MAVIVLIFLTTNVSSAILIHRQRQNYHSLPLYILVIRVSINGTLFLLAAIVLSVCIYKMRTMSSSNVILEAKVYILSTLIFTINLHLFFCPRQKLFYLLSCVLQGTTLCQSLTVSSLITLLYVSRAIYNILAVLLINKIPSFGYGWSNVTSQVQLLIEIHIHVLRQCVSYYLKVPLNFKKFMFDNVPFLNATTMKALIVVLFFVVPHTDTVNTSIQSFMVQQPFASAKHIINCPFIITSISISGRFSGPRQWICIYYVWNHPLCVGVFTYLSDSGLFSC